MTGLIVKLLLSYLALCCCLASEAKTAEEVENYLTELDEKYDIQERLLTELYEKYDTLVQEKRMAENVKSHLTELDEKYDIQERLLTELYEKYDALLQEIALKSLVQQQYVAFTAYPDSNLFCPVGEKIVFNSVLSNYGDHYSTSSGEFSCPVTGLYFFGVTVMTYGDNHVAPQIMVNDDGYTTAQADAAGWDQGTNLLTIECSAGSRVWLRNSNGIGTIIAKDTENMNDILCSFYGFLIALST